nr:integrase, catalytic region, zinc finger, CCHC-type, peptidase aspartic, catalytic [Tanacetum cinerariifolium]
MSRDVLTVSSTMRIPLLYRGGYSQWVERFMNYLEEQTDEEAMINSIKNGDQPLPRVTQVKAAVLYECETFKATEEELLLDTYIRYLQVINDLKKCGYSKDNCELNFKFLNNLQPEWKQYATMMRQNKNLMDINIDALYNILKQNQGDTNVSRNKEKVIVSSDSEGSEADDFSELKKITSLLAKAFNRRKFYSKTTNNNLRTSSSSQSVNKKQEFVKTDNKRVKKKDDEKKRDMSKVKCYNCKKEGHFAKYCKKAKVKDYEYYKTKMLLAKKYKDEQVLLAKDQAWMESSSDSDQEINANRVFMAQIEKVLSDFEASSSSADEKISEVSYYLSESKSEYEFKSLEYYDNSTNYGLFVNNDDDQENFHDAIDSASENFIENHIDSQKDYDKSDVDHNDSEEKEQLVDKLIRKIKKKIAKFQKRVEKANQQSKDFENQNKDLQDKYDVLKNQTTTFEMNNKELNEQMKELIENNNDLLAQTKRVRTDNGTEFKNKTLAKFFDEDVGKLKAKWDMECLLDIQKNLLLLEFTINELDVGKLKAKGDIGVFVGYSKESVAFRIYNKRTHKIHESVNVNFDEISEMASKQFSLEPDFYDEYFESSKIMKSSKMNVETPINEEVFHEVSESFQGESSSSSLNDDVQQSPEEVILPLSNTQSIPINMVPNGDEASTSHNTYYQPYPHEKKWTKDHPHHKIIGDPKSSVRTRDQLANSCLFSCLLSSIEPANVAEALRDVDWTAFLNGILKEEVYVGQPLGFVSKQYPDQVYAVDKALMKAVLNLMAIEYFRSIPELKEKKVYALVHLSLKKKRSLL